MPQNSDNQYFNDSWRNCVPVNVIKQQSDMWQKVFEKIMTEWADILQPPEFAANIPSLLLRIALEHITQKVSHARELKRIAKYMALRQGLSHRLDFCTEIEDQNFVANHSSTTKLANPLLLRASLDSLLSLMQQSIQGNGKKRKSEDAFVSVIFETNPYTRWKGVARPEVIVEFRKNKKWNRSFFKAMKTCLNTPKTFAEHIAAGIPRFLLTYVKRALEKRIEDGFVPQAKANEYRVIMSVIEARRPLVPEVDNVSVSLIRAVFPQVYSPWAEVIMMTKGMIGQQPFKVEEQKITDTSMPHFLYVRRLTDSSSESYSASDDSVVSGSPADTHGLVQMNCVEQYFHVTELPTQSTYFNSFNISNDQLCDSHQAETDANQNRTTLIC